MFCSGSIRWGWCMKQKSAVDVDSKQARRQSRKGGALPRVFWNDHEEQEQPSKDETETATWKSASDPRTGRVYYYHTVTRETQWQKPDELCTEEEKAAMAAREERQRAFFSKMEDNIRRSLARGSIPGDCSDYASGDDASQRGFRRRDGSTCPSLTASPSSSSSSSASSSSSDPYDRCSSDEESSLFSTGKMEKSGQANATKVRTISSMDSLLLHELGGVETRTPSSVVSVWNCDGNSFKVREQESTPRHGADIDLHGQQVHRASNVHPIKPVKEAETHNDAGVCNGIYTSSKASGVPDVKAKVGRASSSRTHVRWNTEGVIYVGDTMSAPDVEATMMCACRVFHAHIVHGNRKNLHLRNPSEGYDIFDDERVAPKHEKGAAPVSRGCSRTSADSLLARQLTKERSMLDGSTSKESPTLKEIIEFFNVVYKKSQMQSDCIIVSLIYIERLIKVTNGMFHPCTRNWKSTLFSAMILSSKVWDDLSMLNADFSNFSSSFPLQRINELELNILNCLNYHVKVSTSEYAKYYFFLRSMMIKSGVGVGDANPRASCNMEEAKLLEKASSKYEKTALAAATNQRAASLTDHDMHTSDVRTMDLCENYKAIVLKQIKA